jgi:hypothetical protein
MARFPDVSGEESKERLYELLKAVSYPDLGHDSRLLHRRLPSEC